MAVAEVANDHYADRQRLARAVEGEGISLWESLNPANLAAWAEMLSRLVLVLTGGQRAAAGRSNDYVGAILAEQGIAADPVGAVNPDAFAGVASDGRSLDGLLWSPVTATKTAVALGTPARRAMATGEANLRMILRTQVSDAGRVADGVGVAARPGVGYVRVLRGKSCARCAILAGRFYRWSSGFPRHPNCDCYHMPSRRDDAQDEDLVTDPREYFDSLSEEEQDRIFTKAGARAIRDGADMGQVVNVRRSAAGLSKAGGRLTAEERSALRAGGPDRGRLERTDVFGQQVFTTTEGTTTRGLAGQRLAQQGGRVAGEAAETATRRSRAGDVQRTVQRQRVQVPRLMPESIYELATSREDAVRLLKRFGYII